MESTLVVHLNLKNRLMKKTITLSVPQPCQESWDQFNVTTAGRHCDKCATTVWDFSQMTEQELMDFLTHRKHKVCGRFRQDQLASYPVSSTSKHIGFPWLKAGILSFLLASSSPLLAQNQIKDRQEQVETTSTSIEKTSIPTLRGQVLCEGEPLPGANIYTKDGEKGVIADIDGYFTLPAGTKPGEMFICSFIGFESQEFIVPNNTVELMELQMENNYLIMGSLEVLEPQEVGFFRKLKHNITKIFKS